jgi:hypothetical protein
MDTFAESSIYAISDLSVNLADEVDLLANPGYDSKVVNPLCADLNVAHYGAFWL